MTTNKTIQDSDKLAKEFKSFLQGFNKILEANQRLLDIKNMKQAKRS